MASLVRSQEETMLAGAARGFLDQHAPVAHLRGLRDAGRTHDRELWAEMAVMGWAGVLVPPSAGGAAMGHAAAGILAQEMGRTLATSPFLSTAVIAATALSKVADARAAEALAAIAAGERTYALALDEGPKFAPGDVAMEARAEGNGFRLEGEKRFVVDGALADRLLVLARTEAGPTLFDLPATRDGIGRDARAMIDSRDAARIRFRGVEATGGNVLGGVGEGMSVLAPALAAGQAALAAELSGLASGAFSMTVGYLGERRQFGVPIGAFQALQHRAAHLWSEIEITASAVLNAGRALDDESGDESRDESGGAAALAVSLAKARACDTARLAVSEGVQMHGGIGMTDAFDMGFYMKRARVGAEWLGDYGYHAEIVGRARGL